MKITALLLAGGRSTRMGRDKAFLEWHGAPLWKIQCEKLQSLAPLELFISCRRDQDFSSSGVSLIYDSTETSSPLEAIAACLHLVQMPVLVLAVDLPNMSTAALRVLVDHHNKTKRGVVFECANRFEPLCGIYPVEMLNVLDDAIAQRHLALQNAVRTGIERKWMAALPLPAEFESAFMNTNTPEEWTQALSKP